MSSTKRRGTVAETANLGKAGSQPSAAPEKKQGTSSVRATTPSTGRMRHDYAEECGALHVQIINLSEAFHAEPAVAVQAQLMPLIAALRKTLDAAGAFLMLAEEVLDDGGV